MVLNSDKTSKVFFVLIFVLIFAVFYNFIYFLYHVAQTHPSFIIVHLFDLYNVEFTSP